jgi:hypothetical protein
VYVPLRGEVEIRSLVFKQRSVSWDNFGVVGQISRTSFICPPMPATSHTQTLVAIGPGQICVSKKRTTIFNKDFPRGQVNGFADNLDLKKLKRGTD